MTAVVHLCSSVGGVEINAAFAELVRLAIALFIRCVKRLEHVSSIRPDFAVFFFFSLLSSVVAIEYFEFRLRLLHYCFILRTRDAVFSVLKSKVVFALQRRLVFFIFLCYLACYLERNKTCCFFKCCRLVKVNLSFYLIYQTLQQDV